MLVKFSTTDDFKTDVEPVAIITDWKQLHKRAGSERFKNVKVGKDQVPVHLLALSACESTGHNRNGDYWLEDDLDRCHHTFVKSGRVHENHKNKITDPVYGKIHASDYHKKMKRVELMIGLDEKNPKNEEALHKIATGKQQAFSMACFPGNTPVLLSNNTERMIKDIAVGDTVITRQGNLGTVSHTMSRAYDDEGILLKCYGLPDEAISTNDHPIWVRPKYQKNCKCPACGKSFSQLRSHLHQIKDIAHQEAYRNFSKAAEGYRLAKDLRVGDFVSTPFSNYVLTTTIDLNYAIVLGYYLAEGNAYTPKKYSKYYWNIDWTFNIKEVEYCNELKKALLALGIEERQISEYERPENTKRVIRCRNIDLLNKLVRDGGKYARSKKLSQEVMEWPLTTQKIVLEKYLEGDGSWHKNHHIVIGSSISKILIWQLCQLAWRNNIIAVFGKCKSKKCTSYTIKFNSDQIKYLSLYKIPKEYGYSERLMTRNLTGLKYQGKDKISLPYSIKKQRCYIEGSCVYHQIYKIEKIHLQEKVYDLTIPGDHSFVANFIGVSNCQVPYDVCSICGHKAPDAKKRCKHIPSQLGEITKEGKMVGMLNPDPEFFEISKVRRPADRVAYSLNNLEKNASDSNNIQDRYTNNLKQAAEIYLPPSLTLSKFASNKRSIVNKLAKLEKHIDMIASGKVENSRDKFIKNELPKINYSSEISDKTISELRKFDHHQLLKALADKGIIFTPEEFFKYIFDNKMNDDHLEGMKTHLPSIHEKLKDNDEELHNEDFEPSSSSRVPSEIMELVKSLTGDHSLFDEPVKNRIMRITIVTRPKVELKKESSVKSKSLFEEQLAVKYANYQLSALSYLDDQGKLTDDFMINTLVVNRR
jgi:hypothetical protein